MSSEKRQTTIPPRTPSRAPGAGAPSALSSPSGQSKRPPPSVVIRLAERAEIVRGATVAALRDPARLAVSAWWTAVHRDNRARAGTLVLALLIVLTIVGALLSPQLGRADELLRAPSAAHALGTDAQGRDLLGALVRGAWPTLAGGVLAALAAGALGVVLGTLSGYLRGVADAFAHRTIETAQALPSVLVVLVVEAAVPNAGFGTLVLAIVLARSAEIAAGIRAEVLRVVALDHVLAARALGAGPGRVFTFHVLPLVLSPVVALVPFAFASAIALETAIQALGVGRVHPLAWGALMGAFRAHPTAWWLVVFPALFVALTASAAALLGEAMRDAADPRLRGG